jgi:hypothetical protein
MSSSRSLTSSLDSRLSDNNDSDLDSLNSELLREQQ